MRYDVEVAEIELHPPDQFGDLPAPRRSSAVVFEGGRRVSEPAVLPLGIAPVAKWLRTHGWNPDKAKGVEIPNAAADIKWSHRQPMLLFHELAHAYQDQVLGHDYPEIKRAYQHARENGKYEAVMRNNGRAERAYAMDNDREYFAEPARLTSEKTISSRLLARS